MNASLPTETRYPATAGVTSTSSFPTWAPAPGMDAPQAGPFSPSQGPTGPGAVAPVVTAWLRRQRSYYYWRFLPAGVVAWIVAASLMANTANILQLPQVLLLGSAIVPLGFVMFCYEQCASTKVPLGLLALAIVSGATIAACLGVFLDDKLVGTSTGLTAGFLVGVAEETAKTLAILVFVRSLRLPHRLHGLLVGAAVGAGFAIVETMGYGLVAFLSGAGQGSLGAALSATNTALVDRMVLAVFGHMAWSAIVGAAIWRERRGATLTVTPSVILAFAIAVVLHASWDGTLMANWPTVTIGILVLPLFDLVVVGPLGLFVLSFFLHEARQREELDPATPLPPLSDALRAYWDSLVRFLGGTSAPRAAGMAPSQPQSAPPIVLPGWPVVPTPYPSQTTTAAADLCSRCGERIPAEAPTCRRCGLPRTATRPVPTIWTPKAPQAPNLPAA